MIPSEYLALPRGKTLYEADLRTHLGICWGSNWSMLKKCFVAGQIMLMTFAVYGGSSYALLLPSLFSCALVKG